MTSLRIFLATMGAIIAGGLGVALAFLLSTGYFRRREKVAKLPGMRVRR